MFMFRNIVVISFGALFGTVCSNTLPNSVYVDLSPQVHFIPTQRNEVLHALFDDLTEADWERTFSLPLPNGMEVTYLIRNATLISLEKSIPDLFLFEGSAVDGVGLKKGEHIELHGIYSKHSGLGLTMTSNVHGEMFLDKSYYEDGQWDTYKTYNRAYAMRIVDEANEDTGVSPTVDLSIRSSASNIGNDDDQQRQPASEIESPSEPLSCPDEYAQVAQLDVFSTFETCAASYNTEECKFAMGSCCGPYTTGCTVSNSTFCGCQEQRRNSVEIRTYRMLLRTTEKIATSLGGVTQAYHTLVGQVHRANLILYRELGVVIQVVNDSREHIGAVPHISMEDDYPHVAESHVSLSESTKNNNIKYDVAIQVFSASTKDNVTLNADMFQLDGFACEDYIALGTEFPIKQPNQASFNLQNGGRTFFRNYLLAVGFALGLPIPTKGCQSTLGPDTLSEVFHGVKYENVQRGTVERGMGYSVMSMPAELCSDIEREQPYRFSIFHSRSLESMRKNTLKHEYSNCGSVIRSHPKPVPVPQVPTLSHNNEYRHCVIPIQSPFRLQAINLPIAPKSLLYSWEQGDVDKSGETGWYTPNNQGNVLFRLQEPAIDPVRFFPQLDVVLRGNLNAELSEQLPTSARQSHFTLVTRQILQVDYSFPVYSTSVSDRIMVEFVDNVVPLSVHELLLVEDHMLLISWQGGKPYQSVRVLASVYGKHESSPQQQGFSIALGEFPTTITSTKVAMSSATGLCAPDDENAYEVRILIETAKDSKGYYVEGCTAFAVSPNVIQLPICKQEEGKHGLSSSGTVVGITESSEEYIHVKGGSPNSVMHWGIHGKLGMPIQLTFHMFDLEYGFDWLNVFDGKDSKAPLLRQFSGNYVPLPVTSTSGDLYIEYVLDGSVDSKGFLVRATNVENDPGTVPPSSPGTNLPTTRAPTVVSNDETTIAVSVTLVLLFAAVGYAAMHTGIVNRLMVTRFDRTDSLQTDSVSNGKHELATVENPLFAKHYF